MSTRLRKLMLGASVVLVGLIAAIARLLVDASNDPREFVPARLVAVKFADGCCEGFEQARLNQLGAALRGGAWRETEWAPLQVMVNGVRQPLEGELPATPARGGLAASIRVTLASQVAEHIEVLGVDTDSERALRVKEQVQAGQFGEAVRYAKVDGCHYGLDAAALPALLDQLAMGGIPRVPTRLRPDYTFGVDWPARQSVDGRWVVSWRKGYAGEPRLLLAVEPTMAAALVHARRCLDRASARD